MILATLMSSQKNENKIKLEQQLGGRDEITVVSLVTTVCLVMVEEMQNKMALP